MSEITFVDGDQVIKATLDDSVHRDGGDKVTTKWLTGTQDDIERAVQKQYKDGTIEKYTVDVSRPGLLSTFIFSSTAGTCRTC